MAYRSRENRFFKFIVDFYLANEAQTREIWMEIERKNVLIEINFQTGKRGWRKDVCGWLEDYQIIKRFKYLGGC